MDKFFLEINCINLESSKERLDHMINEFNKNNIRLKRYNAVNGNNFENIATNTEKKMFDNCDFNGHINNNNIKSCALSHIRLIKSFLNRNDNYYIISEDDFCFTQNGCIKIIETIIDVNNQDNTWDIIFFPYNSDNIKPKKIIKSQWLGAGNVLYVINKNTPYKIISLINKYGLLRALDWFYIDNIDNGINIWLGPNIIKLLDTNSDIHN